MATIETTLDATNPAQIKNRYEKLARIINFDVKFKAAVPISNVSAGNPGDLASDTSFLYVCVSKNLWKRITLQADVW